MFLFCSGLNATIERLFTEGCGRIKEGCSLREKGGCWEWLHRVGIFELCCISKEEEFFRQRGPLEMAWCPLSVKSSSFGILVYHTEGRT